MASGRLLPALSGELRPASLLKKETLARVISYKFREISNNTFFREHLWATASVKNVRNLFWEKFMSHT